MLESVHNRDIISESVLNNLIDLDVFKVRSYMVC